MKKKITGGARFRKEQMNNRFKKLAYLGIALIAFIITGTIFDDVLSGLAMASMLPVGFEFKTLAKGLGKGDPDPEPDPTEEIKKINEEYKAKHKELRDLIEKAGKQEDIDKMKSELKELTEKRISASEDLIKKQQEIAIKQGEQLTALREEFKAAIASKASTKNLTEALTAAFKEKESELKALLADPTNQTKGLTLKVAVVMGNDTTIGAGTTQNTLTQNTGIVSQIRSRELTYRAVVSTGSIGTERALWIEETDEQGTPIFIGEGDSKTQLSVLYVEKTESVKKIAVYGKVTTELMADLPQLVSYIQNNLLKRLDLKVEDKLIYATGTGDDPKGMNHYATAFAAPTSVAAHITAPNEFDVLEAVALQVKEAHGLPNAIFIHPGTMSKMKLIKDQADRPVWKDYVTIDGSMKISGMTIIESTAITAGTFVGGDTTAVNLLIREELGIQIGLDGNDFTQNKKTMLVEKRLVQFVSANDTPVLVKGDFATAIAALTIV